MRPIIAGTHVFHANCDPGGAPVAGNLSSPGPTTLQRSEPFYTSATEAGWEFEWTSVVNGLTMSLTVVCAYPTL